MEEERLFDSNYLSEEDQDNSLRPQRLDEYIGQDTIKGNLSIFIKAALSRNEALDHTLLYGPPGLGKTTLAHIIANEMGSQIRVTSGPAVESAGDLAAILTNLQDRDVLFIDEIHRLKKTTEEMLYSAMEDYSLDLILGKGPSAKTVRIDLPKFTIIGATTKAGSISAPLRDRFGVHLRLESYTNEALSQIVRRSSSVLNLNIDEEATIKIASVSRGTPRIANRILKRVRDFAQVFGKTLIDLEMTQKSLSFMEIDELGLDRIDRAILNTIIGKFSGGPVGLETLAAAIGEDSVTIEDLYEPYLMQICYIARTPRGRVALKDAYLHLNKEYNGDLE